MTILTLAIADAEYLMTIEAVEEAKTVAHIYLDNHLISFEIHTIVIKYLNNLEEEINHGE